MVGHKKDRPGGRNARQIRIGNRIRYPQDRQALFEKRSPAFLTAGHECPVMGVQLLRLEDRFQHPLDQTQQAAGQAVAAQFPKIDKRCFNGLHTRFKDFLLWGRPSLGRGFIKASGIASREFPVTM